MSTEHYVELVRVVRSGFDECSHFGAMVITGSDGAVRYALGDPEQPIFPRSSNKPFQAIAMLEAGAALAGPDLALAAASHSGEPMHVERARAILAAAGLTEDDLRCPPDLPGDETARNAVIRAGEPPRRIYMNCSGKHSGMLTACVAGGWDTRSYLDPAHPYQQLVSAAVTRITGELPAAVGVDGCGAPLLGTSLTGLARGFGRLTTAEEGTPDRAVADAMRAHPELVAGTGRDDTLVMSAHPGVLMKGGAEGVHVAALPDGSAVAVKISDGAARARMPVLVAGLRALGLDSDMLTELAAPPVLGGGLAVGRVTLAPGVAPTL
ncbi:asparaginase [Nakamurella lactea]|uniref:asparaginase n=1 Tax=Nakamurella lactea TaxID=459515 RepID=UPI000428C860|nr:asparaginase [Nakamurella lactea]